MTSTEPDIPEAGSPHVRDGWESGKEQRVHHVLSVPQPHLAVVSVWGVPRPGQLRHSQPSASRGVAQDRVPGEQVQPQEYAGGSKHAQALRRESLALREEDWAGDRLEAEVTYGGHVSQESDAWTQRRPRHVAQVRQLGLKGV